MQAHPFPWLQRQVVAHTLPDVAVVDIALKNSGGIELIKRIRDRKDNVRILVWSMYSETLNPSTIVAAG